MAVNEFELINLLSRALPSNPAVVTGVGDDCAVLDLGVPGQWVLFKTDAVVEGLHFTAEAAPERIGHKALARCLSDIAAMAGTPTAALVTLGLPREFDTKFVEAVYAGMSKLAARYNVAIVGGETTTNPERMLLSIALLGTVARERCLMRSGAKAGDGIFVTGELGGSLAGKHLDFEPRLAEAQWVAQQFPVHAMIDLSDGLAGDLRHILKASGVGAELLSDAIPISREAKLRARSAEPGAGTAESFWVSGGGVESSEVSQSPGLPVSESALPPGLSTLNNSLSTTHVPKTPLTAAMTDGEDFELLFTVPSKEAVRLVDGWKKQFPNLRLSCIGKITAEPGLRIRDRKGIQPLNAHGYVHFEKS